ncbi:hypothetical protein GH789_04760 [Rhizobium pusense]|uniref:hypothetical protein n=1 Tax=Agrobacterium pusense TaxID=648995 RepID=UPI00129BAEA4|nr:hypothetical protein [Agrobacterium pusense]MRG64596.1 hypothetical protein [Agrobacterium pusense]
MLSSLNQTVKLAAIFLLSLFCGAALTAGSVALFSIKDSLSTEGVKVSDITTLVAGIVGAALGGAISWMQSRKSARETLQRDNEARLSIIENNALSTLLKVQRMANGYHTQKMYFWKQLREANAKKTINYPLWQILRSQIGGAEAAITFSAEEFIPLHLAGEIDLINECGLLAERYQVIERAMIEYTRLRRELEDLLADHTTRLPDGKRQSEVPEELRNKVGMKAELLEEFVRSLYADISSDEVRAKALCENVSTAFSRRFSDRIKFKMTFVEDEH